MKSASARATLGSAALLSLLLLAGCQKEEAPKQAAPAPKVGVVTLEAQTYTLTTELPGRTPIRHEPSGCCEPHSNLLADTFAKSNFRKRSAVKPCSARSWIASLHPQNCVGWVMTGLLFGK